MTDWHLDCHQDHCGKLIREENDSLRALFKNSATVGRFSVGFVFFRWQRDSRGRFLMDNAAHE
jgi:hypothetical protein